MLQKMSFNLINEDWVKIKVKLGGICGTDLHMLVLNVSTALSNFASYPAVFGHELVGSIVELCRFHCGAWKEC